MDVGSVGPADDIGDSRDWSPAERALLDAALEFYGAAESVIDLGGKERPRLRYDVNGLQAVREAMSALEARILAAGAEGVGPERIAGITRLDREIVAMILAGRKAGEPEDAAPAG